MAAVLIPTHTHDLLTRAKLEPECSYWKSLRVKCMSENFGLVPPRSVCLPACLYIAFYKCLVVRYTLSGDVPLSAYLFVNTRIGTLESVYVSV